jgi:4-amino-4-deoxy-L-arabinose transferase-like glycosyltransferase
MRHLWLDRLNRFSRFLNLAGDKLRTSLTPVNQGVTERGVIYRFPRTSLLVVLIVGIGSFLRLRDLNNWSLWEDEAYSFWFANRSWTDILPTVRFSGIHPPLYYLLLRLVLPVGQDEVMLRLPSALLGIASIYLMYRIGRECFDKNTAIISSLLLAFSPVHIWYAREARMYALVSFFLLAAGFFALRALRNNRAFDWVMLVIFQALALWTNIGAVWFSVAINFAVLVSAQSLRSDKRLLKWTASQVCAALIFLPWVPSFFTQLRIGVLGTSWIPPATIENLVRTVDQLVVSYGDEWDQPFMWAQPFTLQSDVLLMPAVLTLIFLAGAPSLYRYMKSHQLQFTVLLSWFLVPIGLIFLISQPYMPVPLLSGNSLLLTRNLLFVSFPLYLLMAKSLSVAWTPLRIILLGTVLALNAEAYVTNIDRSDGFWEEDHRRAAEIVAAQVEEKDAIIAVPGRFMGAFCYYYCDRSSMGIPYNTAINGIIVNEKDLVLEDVAAALNKSERVWVIQGTQGTSDVLRGEVPIAVQDAGNLIASWRANALVISLYAVQDVPDLPAFQDVTSLPLDGGSADAEPIASPSMVDPDDIQKRKAKRRKGAEGKKDGKGRQNQRGLATGLRSGTDRPIGHRADGNASGTGSASCVGSEKLALSDPQSLCSPPRLGEQRTLPPSS